MNNSDSNSIVSLKQFIEAVRDSGYKNTATAVAELVDNSLEANATQVDVHIGIIEEGDNKRETSLSVADDGNGMTPSVLRTALQFGGSTRFNSRQGMGRYGMGLPNSPLSQARRVEVYSWTKPGVIWWTYLDVDEIASGELSEVPQPRRQRLDSIFNQFTSKRGTVVVWSKCDRLSPKRLNTVIKNLHAELGRIFREHLWEGKIITINGDPVEPIDPLFLRNGKNLMGAKPYGDLLNYEIKIPTSSGYNETSTVTVRFTELPIYEWHGYSNKEKRDYGITNNAGVSILRAKREIDHGWYFIGHKRKENYDDWWRCEIHFEPVLDELFGVTHTKQRIYPSQMLIDILAPDIETIARRLNARVRQKYAKINSGQVRADAESLAENRDHLLEPSPLVFGSGNTFPVSSTDRIDFFGLRYKIRKQRMNETNFFKTSVDNATLEILINENHPFFKEVYEPLLKSNNADAKMFLRLLQLLLFAAARAEHQFNTTNGNLIRDYRELWSRILATFLS